MTLPPARPSCWAANALVSNSVDRVLTAQCRSSVSREVREPDGVTAVGVVADEYVDVAELAVHRGDQPLCCGGIAQISSYVDDAGGPTQALPQLCEEGGKVLGGAVLVSVVRQVVVDGERGTH